MVTLSVMWYNGARTTLICLLSLLAFVEGSELLTLRVNEQRVGEHIRLDSEIKTYVLIDLSPLSSYEVRVSYPATVPARVVFAFDEFAATNRRRLFRLRKLLDCEKCIFRTDGSARVLGSLNPKVLLRAERKGLSFHRDGPAAGGPTLVYNIALVPLWLGIPLDTFPIIIGVLLLLCAVLFLYRTWSRKIFPRVLDWLDSSKDAASKRGL